MLWNRIFENLRTDDTTREHELPVIPRTVASDNVSLVAYGNGRWA